MAQHDSPPGKRNQLWKLLLAALVVAGLLLIRNDVTSFLRTVLQTVAELGPWGPIAFLLVYVAATVLLLPGFILTLGAGFVFGLGWGTALVSASSTLGATASFLVGRYLAREWVAGKMRAFPRFAAVDEAVAQEGWKIVGLTRLSPVFPFNLLNYAFGITRVKLRHYVPASWLGMLPGTVLYVYIGSLAGDLATLGAEGRARTPQEWAFYVVGLLATAAVTIQVTRLARRALEKRVS
jgi:uncharacterized membrane protein YdjX (TVP38/TMEM64 family)